MARNPFPDPPTTPAALAHHAEQLADMDDAARADYLDDFSGRQKPPPAKGYPAGTVAKSLRAVLGDDRTAALIARANAVRVKRAKA